MTLSDVASHVRLNNFIKKLGANLDQIESLIGNLLKSDMPPERIADVTNQLFELSKSESITPAEVPAFMKHKMEEKQRLEEEIRKSGAILEQKNVDIQTIEEYQALKDELKKHSLPIENPRRFASILQTIDHIGNNPRKIIRELEPIISLKQTERSLKNSCEMWESRANRYKEIIPMCEHVVSRGDLGLSLLMALHAAVLKKIEVDGVPAGAAPFQVMNDIDGYNRHGGMKKQLYDTLIQINVTKEFLGRQNDAINTFMKLRLYGMTEDQILKTCRSIEANGPRNMNGTPSIKSEYSVF